MQNLNTHCKVALVQAAPTLFDVSQSLEKTLQLIQQASSGHPDLIVFPELFLPGYPYGMTFGFVVGHRDEGGRRDWFRYAENSVLVPGPITAKLGEAARHANAYLSIGVSERDAISGTLYNSNLIFTPDGTLSAVHRKLKPTGAERVVWGDADRGYFPMVQTEWGPIGALICWENYMPLARTALYQRGTTIYLAPNTNDNPEWQSTVEHIAIEGRCWVINANQFFRRTDYPTDLVTATELEDLPDVVCRGGSSIIAPTGHPVAGPLWDEEGILTATLDLDATTSSRMEFDPIGHYARPDIFDFKVRDL